MSRNRVQLYGIKVSRLLAGVLVALSPSQQLMKVEGQPNLLQVAEGMNRGSSAKHDVLRKEQLQRHLSRLRDLSRAKNLDGLVSAANELERTWAPGGGDNYARLMLQVSNMIANDFEHKNAFTLSQKYAVAALGRAETFPLEMESQLLLFAERNLAQGITTPEKPGRWMEERSMKAKLFLHAWRRLEKEINRNFDFNASLYLNVPPPKETGLPSGVTPSAIKDPKLRDKYEADIKANAARVREYNLQLGLQQLDKTLPQRAERYLINAYSTPPHDMKSLENLLRTHGIARQVRNKMLSEVSKRSTAPR